MKYVYTSEDKPATHQNLTKLIGGFLSVRILRASRIAKLVLKRHISYFVRVSSMYCIALEEDSFGVVSVVMMFVLS